MNDLAGHPAQEPTMSLKLALRRLAASVTVITVRDANGRHAMAATAVNALSMAPPSLLACINTQASIHKAMTSAQHFAINILGRQHESLSHRCGGQAKGEARFETGSWDDNGPVPILADAQAAIICRADAQFAYGSHTIFVGVAETVKIHGNLDPLVYLDGRYTGVTIG